MTPKESAQKTVKTAFEVFGKDLQALPEQAFTQKFAEKTRTVADIVYEVCLVNDHVGMVLQGKEPFPWPEGGWVQAPEDLQSKDSVIAHFASSAKSFEDLINGMSEEDLSKEVETEHGPSSGLDRCRFVALHTWYHSGQLNFIQTLLGDDDWHW